MEKKEAEAGKKSVTVERTKGVMMQNKAEGVGWGPKRGEERRLLPDGLKWSLRRAHTYEQRRGEKRREASDVGGRDRGKEGGREERENEWVLDDETLPIPFCVYLLHLPFLLQPLAIAQTCYLTCYYYSTTMVVFSFHCVWLEEGGGGRSSSLSLSLSSSL